MSTTGQQLVIEVYEIQPTSESTPPLTKPESLPVPFRQRNLSFSPACFDASFDAEAEVIIPRQHGNHVVAHSTSGTHTAIAWRGRALFGSRSPDTPRQFIDAGMKIQDVGIVGGTTFVVDMHRLAWDDDYW